MTSLSSWRAPLWNSVMICAVDSVCGVWVLGGRVCGAYQLCVCVHACVSTHGAYLLCV